MKGVSREFKAIYEEGEEKYCLNDLTNIVKERKRLWKLPLMYGSKQDWNDCMPPIATERPSQASRYIAYHFERMSSKMGYIFYRQGLGHTSSDLFYRRMFNFHELYNCIYKQKNILLTLKYFYNGQKWDEILDVSTREGCTILDLCYKLETNGGLFAIVSWAN